MTQEELRGLTKVLRPKDEPLTGDQQAYLRRGEGGHRAGARRGDDRAPHRWLPRARARPAGRAARPLRPEPDHVGWEDGAAQGALGQGGSLPHRGLRALQEAHAEGVVFLDR